MAKKLPDTRMIAERMIEGPQGQLNVSETHEGDGTPILFIHSDGGNLHHWDKIRLELGRRSSAAFDRRGHGKSDFPLSESFVHEDAAADIAAVADALGYERFFLVAHSGGALDAYVFASEEPDRVVGLVLVDPPPDPKVLPPGMMDETLEKLRGPDYARTVDEYYRSIAGDNPKVTETLLGDIRTTDKDAVIGTFEANARFRPENFTGYHGPGLSIIQPQYDVDGALHRIADMDHVAIGGAGHWIHLAEPDQFLDALEDFVALVDRPTPGGHGLHGRIEGRTGR